MKKHTVAIIGGGLGGLCLANGLKKAGISVTVYERDQSPESRPQGYRIHIDPQGSTALHQCLPSHLWDLFASTGGDFSQGFSIVTEQLGLGGLPVSHAPWWLLVPIPERESSYAPLVFFAVILVVVVLAIFNVRLFYHQRIRKGAAWDCGFGGLNSRMQDTAEGFGQPIRHLFQPLFAIVRELPSPFDSKPKYRLEIGDRIWRALYQPLGTFVRQVADRVAWLQQGRIATYLLYSFVTLVVLLALML